MLLSDAHLLGGYAIAPTPLEIPFTDRGAAQPLPALIEGPADARIGILLGHGAGGDMHTPLFAAFATALAEAGHRVMRFQFPYRAAAAAGKRRPPDRMPRLLAAFAAAWSTARQTHPAATRWILGGKSLGGRAASLLAVDAPPDGLLLLGYPLHPPGKTDRPRTDHLWELEVPLLFLQGTRDALAQADLMAAVIERLADRGRAAEIHWLEGGDHSFRVPKRAGRTEAEIVGELARASDAWLRAR